MACGLSQQELRDFGIALVDSRCQAQQADGSLCGDLVTAHCVSNKKLNALVVGPAEGGSGTLFKQIAVAFGNGISESQRTMFLPVMISGIISSLRALMRKVGRGIIVKSPESWDFVMGDVDTINPSNVHHFLGVWGELAIQAAHREMLCANLEYFMKRLPALASQDFVPSTEDYMWMHYPTRGLIFHRQLALPEGVQCKVTFLGSFRAENLLAYDADVVMFVANLMSVRSPSDLANDLAFFERVCNARTMAKASICLLLNKNDLFQPMKRENNEARNDKQIHDIYSEQDHRAWDGALLPSSFFPLAIPGPVLYIISAYVGRFLPIFYTTLTDSVQAKSVLSKCLQL